MNTDGRLLQIAAKSTFLPSCWVSMRVSRFMSSLHNRLSGMYALNECGWLPFFCIDSHSHFFDRGTMFVLFVFGCLSVKRWSSVIGLDC